jgi:hypothetical protein
VHVFVDVNVDVIVVVHVLVDAAGFSGMCKMTSPGHR